jgi:hypothetical protein
VKLRRDADAHEVCGGIVAGLYRAEQRGLELFEYAVDSPAELASHAVGLWRGRRTVGLSPEFLERYAPEWDWLLRAGKKMAHPGRVVSTP